jgi:hypothetical protein
VELFASVPVGVVNFNGCCHLGTELNRLCCQKRTFLADAAVTRTRRLVLDQPDPTTRRLSSPAAACGSFARVHRLRRSPTTDAATHLVSGPPQRQPPFSPFS